jgi:hypothetical protein
MLMMIEFLRKLEKPKWLHRRDILAIVILILVSIFTDAIWGYLAILAIFASPLAGIVVGRLLGRYMNAKFLKRSADFERRLSGGFSAFGFVFMPAMIHYCNNIYLKSDIGTQYLVEGFFIGCIAGAIFFCFRPTEGEH